MQILIIQNYCRCMFADKCFISQLFFFQYFYKHWFINWSNLIMIYLVGNR